MATVWNMLTKLVDFDKRTSFLDNVNLVCAQRECKVNEGSVDQYRENVRITNFCQST